MSQSKTIAKIVLTCIALFVMFIPVMAIQQIEARTVSHVLEVEGMYVNGTAIETAPLTNVTMNMLETCYSISITNETGADPDSATYFRGAGINREIRYSDSVTYIGNGSYSVSLNLTNEPAYAYSTRNFYVPLDMNITDLMTPDFLRIKSDWTVAPRIFFVATSNIDGTGGAVYGNVMGAVQPEIADGEWLWINSIQTRSYLQSVEDNNMVGQIFLEYQLGYNDPATDSFTWSITEETLSGADAFTWTDETLYIMAVMLCDVMLIGAILFASDPIDISIERPRKRR